ncbi:MAG TPA: dienelactone hydrolase family protein [Puia sp.]|nr:dienelactone hydrolase family protein [Puia sp.]
MYNKKPIDNGAGLVTTGAELTAASKVLIMTHGRGANAADILTLAEYLPVEDFTLLAPQADGNSWYPYSFMEPPVRNEPWLSASLDRLQNLVGGLRAKGISDDRIYFLGFSQGACLTLEFVTRHATGYGGVVAFTGGLIGDKIYTNNYKGDFAGTPVFIGTSDPDPHVPVARVRATTTLLRGMNADVTEKVYPGMGHTISSDEIQQARRVVFREMADSTTR